MNDIDINSLRGTATWDRSQQGGASADPFQELANAVILLAAKDYYNLLAGFNLTPPPNRGERYPTIRELERLSMLYRRRTQALHRAAKLQGVEYDLYMKVRKREGI